MIAWRIDIDAVYALCIVTLTSSYFYLGGSCRTHGVAGCRTAIDCAQLRTLAYQQQTALQCNTDYWHE
ncbi:MAG: hypothetical protein AAF268_13440 [Cyanobacteria bacterium P01_A01_bin.3]